MSKKIFSENLKFLIRKRKLTNTKLADILHVKKTRVDYWTKGNYPRLEQYIAICDALDCHGLNILIVNITKGTREPKRATVPREIAEKLEIIQQLAKEALKQ